MFRAFELTRARNDIDHRLTKPNHPWTKGQVERNEPHAQGHPVRRYYYDSQRAHLKAFSTP
jgi:hypothetical protein